MQFYLFSYGSNMSRRELYKYGLHNTCVVGTGYAPNHVFQYRHIKGRKLSAKATIAACERKRVYGTITKVNVTSSADLKRLHQKEGVFKGIYKFVRMQIVCSQTNKRVSCMTYIMTGAGKSEKGTPSQKYLDKLVRAATRYRLPFKYVKRNLMPPLLHS